MRLKDGITYEKMTLGHYFAKRNWSLFADMDPNAEGYMIENSQGFTSWLEEKEFNDQYNESLKMTFGEALQHLKEGCKVARTGWNGKGMFIVYREGYPEGIPCNESTAKAFGYEKGYLFKQLPYLQMRCADGSHQMWLASQSDILAEDWCIVA